MAHVHHPLGCLVMWSRRRSISTAPKNLKYLPCSTLIQQLDALYPGLVIHCLLDSATP